MMEDNPYLSAYESQRSKELLLEQKRRSTAAPVAEQPQTPQPGGPIGFLQNIGKSIGQSYGYLGSGLANVLDEVTGGAERARKVQMESADSDTNAIKQLGVQLRSTQDEAQKERLRSAIAKIGESGNQRDDAFRKRQDEIIQQNDPTKGAASVASIGLDVLGAGTGSAILGGGLKQAIGQGLKQGALYGGAQGALQPLKDKGAEATAEDIGGNAVSGAAVGGLIGGAAGGALRAINPSKAAVVSSESTSPSLVNRMGRRLTESGSGLKADPTTGGVQKLQQQTEFMSKYTGTPRQQRVKMEQDMTSLSKEVDDILSKSPTPIKGDEVRTQVQAAIDDPLKYADVDLSLSGVQKNLESHLNKFQKATTAKELNDYIKQLNPIARRAQDKIARGVTLTDKEAAALTAKRAGDDVLTAIPEIKPLKQNMAQIFEVTPQVSKAAEMKIGLPFVTGINSKAPVQAAKGAQSRIGALLQGVGKGGSKNVDQDALDTAFMPSAAKDIARGTASALLNPAVGRGAAAMQPEQSQGSTQPVEGQLLDAAADPTAGMGSMEDAGDQYASIRAQLQQSALEALAAGDTKGLANIKAVADLFPEPKAGSGGNKPLSAEASKIIANANSGLKSLSQLEAIINKQGGVSAGTLVPGRELFGGAGAAALGTGEYDTAARNVKDVITRLRTGAALTDQEATFYEAQIPQAFDTPEVRAQKLGLFRDLFSSVANRTGSAGTDVQSALGL